ncbi:MAG: response regulator transcription factor [Nocardioides sp.]
MTTVLLVEDEESIALTLQRMLERQGYDVIWAQTGQAGLDAIRTGPDVVLLDLGLPDMDGLDVCQQARDGGYDGGIMILTARSHELDHVVGLDYGADDYMAKPFGIAEMQARLRALVRRAASRPAASPGRGEDERSDHRVEAPAAVDQLEHDTLLRVNVAARRVWVGSQELVLTSKEFEVLGLLAEDRGTVITREQLMAQVWDENWFGSTKTLDVTVGRLRAKLDAARSSAHVVTVRGVGFRLEDGPGSV